MQDGADLIVPLANVASNEIEEPANDAGLNKPTTDAIVNDYEEAQLVVLLGEQSVPAGTSKGDS